MSRLKVRSASQVIEALRHFGFEAVNTRGSHVKLRREGHVGRETLTIPLHKELATGTVLAIYRQALKYVPERELKPWFFST